MRVNTASLRQLSSLITKGTTPKTLGKAYTTEGVPFLRGEDIRGEAVNWRNVGLYIDGTTNKLLGRSIIMPGDLLITIAGTVGRCGYISSDAPLMNCNQAVAIIRLNSELVCPEYACFAIQSPAVVSSVIQQGTTATITNLSLQQIGDLEIPVPTLAEQRRIVDILNHATSIKRLREEARAKVREIVPALFVDIFGDPATNPKGWEVKAVQQVLDRPIRNGISPSKAGKIAGSVLTLSAITRGNFDVTAVKQSTFAAPIAADDEVSAQDFLICRGNGNRDLVGRGAFPSQSMPGVAFPDTAMALRPRKTIICPAYLAALWQTSFVRQQIVRSARTTNGTYKINQEGVSNINIPLPPIVLQQKFAERATEIEGAVALNDKAVLTAEQLTQSLLARVFGSQQSETLEFSAA